MVKQAEETIDGLCHLYGFPQDYPSFPQVLCALLGPPDLPMDSQPWKSLGFGHGKMRTTGLASIPSLLAGSCRALLRLTTPAAKREQKPPEPWNIYIYIYHYDIMCMYIYIYLIIFEHTELHSIQITTQQSLQIVNVQCIGIPKNTGHWTPLSWRGGEQTPTNHYHLPVTWRAEAAHFPNTPGQSRRM